MRPPGLLLGVLGIALAVGIAAGHLPRLGAPPARPFVPREDQVAESERTGFPVEIENDLGMRFRLVPPGSFRMGTAPSAAAEDGESCAHDVRLRAPYYLQVTEVTNAQFRQFRPEHRSGTAPGGASLDGEEQPVVNVTHDDAVRFAAWLAERDRRFPWRLPTEAEWEHAACGAGEAHAPAGARQGGAAPLASLPVGSSAPNAWGLCDLEGNVAEWCHDRYGPYPDWPQDDPQGATTGTEFVARGASWRDGPGPVPPTRRLHLPEGRADACTGIRLATSLGYARAEHGCCEVLLVTVDPTVEADGAPERPGYALRMMDTRDRLTDRQNDPSGKPRWVDLRGVSPRRVRLAPGRYYVYAWRLVDGLLRRGLEVKFEVPGVTVMPVPVPRADQVAPQ